MKTPFVYIIHGYMAHPENHWFPWLKNNLDAIGVETDILLMPDSSNPKVNEWISFLQKTIHRHDERTFFVAHSLGCITLLRYLNIMDTMDRIGGMILVSGFAESLPLHPELDEFTDTHIDYRAIMGIAPKRSVIVSDNDLIVPPELTITFCSKLNASLVEVKGGGHFMGSEGFYELPAVWEQLKQMLGV
jgi:uncharacterized protein